MEYLAYSLICAFRPEGIIFHTAMDIAIPISAVISWVEENMVRIAACFASGIFAPKIGSITKVTIPPKKAAFNPAKITKRTQAFTKESLFFVYTQAPIAKIAFPTMITGNIRGITERMGVAPIK